MPNLAFSRILLKLSGEILAGKKGYGIDPEITSNLAIKIKEVAEKGMLSTKDIIATKGRASFLGDRAKGHIDPGARSSQLAIDAICNTIINK